MRLEEKIEYEYKSFYLDQMCRSRENIFAHSKEIEQKKKLKEELHRLAREVDAPTEEYLCLQESLLESAYCFLQDEQQRDDKESVEDAVRKWYRFLVNQKDPDKKVGLQE